MKDSYIMILDSWTKSEGNVTSNVDIRCWIDKLVESTKVIIKDCSINDSTFWFYDEVNGEILNRKRSFFQIKGIQEYRRDELVSEQPIIIQPEIGYLGIICKEFDGVLNFLMQAKIEPGNVNGVQISPTLQATKSNFTKAHGGVLPNYLRYFENAARHHILVDQIQSEQASRFYKKRNRNMIIQVDEDIEILPNYRWMTLGQIKKLMCLNNYVNMDTRTVLSGISFSGINFSPSQMHRLNEMIPDKAFFHSLFAKDFLVSTISIYNFINDYRMFHESKHVLVPLNHLSSWKVSPFGIKCKKAANFEVGFFDIVIEGREVQEWTQPLFRANGQATFGLIYCVDGDETKYLVSIRPEIGSFDVAELGPSVVFDPLQDPSNDNAVDALFRQHLNSARNGGDFTGKNESIMFDVIFSEEGGRFYHEQNRNVIMRIDKAEIGSLATGYFWVTLGDLGTFLRFNNCLNIQLRNLLSLLEI